MSFIDILRNARSSRVAVLHQFWIQYDPNQRRVHAFFEGHDDAIFFAPFLEQFSTGSSLYTYRCEGKKRVFEVFTQITERRPDVKSVLFFVDKDVDDILGVPWPTDPRIFVTDVYSIENYVVTPAVLKRLYRDCVRLTGVTFDDEDIVVQFEHQLNRFYQKMLSIMAWIVVTRRGGARPNLNNVNMRDLCIISDACEVRALRQRQTYLDRATGVTTSRGAFRRIVQASKELARIPPKRITRGKFEAWFFVEFWKKLVSQLQALAQESGGKVQFKIALEHSTFVSTLVHYAEIPRSLELFLRAHLPQASGTPGSGPAQARARDLSRPWWKRIIGF